MNWIVSRTESLHGSLDVPGDKSITHRLAMLTSLAQGTSRIDNFLASEDCLSTLASMESMGAGVNRDGTTVTVEGTAGRLHSPDHDLDCGNSGTGMRLLAGLLSGFSVSARLVGDASLMSRPMQRILDPLRAMGACVHAEGTNARPPLRTDAARLKGITYALPVASAQVKSCLLLAGLRAQGETCIVEPLGSRDHTERLFRAMGLPLRVEDGCVRLAGSGGRPPTIPARRWNVPGDISSASFWLVAAAILPGSSVTIRNLGLNPSRTALLDVLRRMGADVHIGPVREQEWEPQADVTVLGGTPLRGTEICGPTIPNLIDEIPVLCVAAACAKGLTRIRDAAELRVKESDRIETTAAMLHAVGIPVVTCEDGLEVEGGHTAQGGEVCSHGDHRIAMSAAVLALASAQPIMIRNTTCVATSYPDFARHLEILAPGALTESNGAHRRGFAEA